MGAGGAQMMQNMQNQQGNQNQQPQGGGEKEMSRDEVMKTLTIIATIFIPLTFIVGIYGMNFRHMPELEWVWGYPGVWGVMITVVVVMVLYFRRRGWF